MKKLLSYLLLIFSAASLTAAELVLEKLSCSGKPGSVLSAAVPFQGKFKLSGTNQEAKEQTRVKLFHDGKYIYIGVEALESSMDKLVADPDTAKISIWRNDTVEINIDPDGTNVALVKIMIDPNGNVVDMYGLDDNTGNERFTTEICRASNLKVISTKRLSDRWQLELALPVGVFFKGEAKSSFAPRLNIARNRWAKVYEASDLFPDDKGSHSRPRFFPTLVLKDFDPVNYDLRVENLNINSRKENNKFRAAVRGKLFNACGKFRTVKATALLRDARGNVLASGHCGITAHPNKLVDFAIELEPEKLGRCKLELQLSEISGAMLSNQVSECRLSWAPVTIKVLEPCYRNNIYASMKNFKTVRAEITLAEKSDKPLTVTLSGPDYNKSVTINKPQSVNKVEFPFENTREGTYTLQAGEISTTIRKLAYHRGEVYIDQHGIPYVDGKKFLLFGGYGAPADWGKRGANFSHTTNIWKSPAEVRRYLDIMHKYNIKVGIYPYYDPKGEGIFGHKNRIAGKLSERQKELLRELVPVLKNHPALLAYYAADEPEGFGHNEEWYIDLRNFMAELDPYHPVTITNYGTDGQRRFYEGCDVLFADTYPNYFSDNSTYLGRRVNFEYISHAAKLRPAWQMIQSFDWGKPSANGIPGRAPTYDELREQMFTALLANAKGILFYTFNYYGNYSYQLSIGRNYLGPELDSMKDLLLAPTENLIQASGKFAAKDLLYGVKRHGSDLLFIAVNLTEKPVDAKFDSQVDLEDTLYIAGTPDSVKVNNKRTFSDTLPPHVVKLYVTKNVERNAVDLAAVRKQIKDADNSRKKPGNLAFGRELTLYEMNQYKLGKVPAGIPRITVSSQQAVHYPAQATWYFMQDGIRQTKPYEVMTYTPHRDDKAPWMQLEFDKPTLINRSVFYMGGKGFGIIKSGKLSAEVNGKWQTLWQSEDNRQSLLDIKFEPVRATKLKLDFQLRYQTMATFHEWEVYGPETAEIPR